MGSEKLIDTHECEEDDVCCCGIAAIEPDESCPVHGCGPWPPRCCHCGRFIERAGKTP